MTGWVTPLSTHVASAKVVVETVLVGQKRTSGAATQGMALLRCANGHSWLELGNVLGVQTLVLGCLYEVLGSVFGVHKLVPGYLYRVLAMVCADHIHGHKHV
jgi:hypothetical protein